jgi:hypothetical protein
VLPGRVKAVLSAALRFHKWRPLSRFLSSLQCLTLAGAKAMQTGPWPGSILARRKPLLHGATLLSGDPVKLHWQSAADMLMWSDAHTEDRMYSGLSIRLRHQPLGSGYMFGPVYHLLCQGSDCSIASVFSI